MAQRLRIRPYLDSARLLVLLWSLTLLVQPVQAGQRLVPAEFSTITSAIAAALPGDTILVSGGTFSPSTNGETFPIVITKDDLVLLGAGPDLTILDAADTGSVFYWDNSTGGRISGFHITGGLSDNGGGAEVRGGSPEIDHNVFYQNRAALRGAAIYVIFDASPWIHHNVFWENTDTIPEDESDPHGIILTGTTTAVVEHNLIGRTDGNGILISNQGTPVVRHNIFFENGRTTPTRRGRGICDFSAATTRQIYHNLFWNNEIAAILYPDGGGNISGETANSIAPGDSIYGNIDADPLLEDPDGLVFFLSPFSPAIDAGDPDLTGDPDGTVADLGPFYFDQSTSSVSALPRRSIGALQGVPNPFNPSTVIRFDLARESLVAVRIVDIRGRAVRQLFSGRLQAGTNQVAWDGRNDEGLNVASGVYFCHVGNEGEFATTHLTLIK